MLDIVPDLPAPVAVPEPFKRPVVMYQGRDINQLLTKENMAGFLERALKNRQMKMSRM